jgi:hypothetical protein
MLPADPTERPEAPGSLRARLREATERYAGALIYGDFSTAEVERAALDTLHDDLARDAERLADARTLGAALLRQALEHDGQFVGATHTLTYTDDADLCAWRNGFDETTEADEVFWDDYEAAFDWLTARSAPLVPEDGDD